jgi:uncharacterized protein (TIGR03085 family)
MLVIIRRRLSTHGVAPAARRVIGHLDGSVGLYAGIGVRQRRAEDDAKAIIAGRPDAALTAGSLIVRPRYCPAAMVDVHFDALERLALSDLFDELGPDVPTLLDGWTARDLAAHLVLRERDLIAAPCLVLPGGFQQFAERRRIRMAQQREFGWLVARIRSGPPPGFFRIGWVRSVPNLNEFFVHHEDVRRANGGGPRINLTPAMEAALWRNVRQGGRYLSRRLRQVGLEIGWAGTEERITARKGTPTVRVSGPPGELLLYAFGRQAVAQVEVTGPAGAVAIVQRTHFGM